MRSGLGGGVSIEARGWVALASLAVQVRAEVPALVTNQQAKKSGVPGAIE